MVLSFLWLCFFSSFIIILLIRFSWFFWAFVRHTIIFWEILIVLLFRSFCFLCDKHIFIRLILHCASFVYLSFHPAMWQTIPLFQTRRAKPREKTRTNDRSHLTARQKVVNDENFCYHNNHKSWWKPIIWTMQKNSIVDKTFWGVSNWKQSISSGALWVWEKLPYRNN